MTRPKILLITGPQGSGNHVFSKALSLHPEVKGWGELLDKYWIRHEFEPYADLFRDPQNVHKEDWSASEYHVISVSCPYVDSTAVGRGTIVPRYKQLIPELQKGGDLTIGLIGREEYILKEQEMRLRGTHSYHQFLSLIDYFEQFNPVFLSTELLYLYRHTYLESLQSQLNIPIGWDNPRLNDVLRENQNAKYIKSVDDYWLDGNKKYFEQHNGFNVSEDDDGMEKDGY